jgi:hypothetical protein
MATDSGAATLAKAKTVPIALTTILSSIEFDNFNSMARALVHTEIA